MCSKYLSSLGLKQYFWKNLKFENIKQKYECYQQHHHSHFIKIYNYVVTCIFCDVSDIILVQWLIDILAISTTTLLFCHMSPPAAAQVAAQLRHSEQCIKINTEFVGALA